MKQKLLSSFRLRVVMLVAILCCAFTGQTWGENVTLKAGTNGSSCTVNSKDGIKVGTSSKGGDMTITVPANTTTLHLHAAAWKGVTGLSLNISGATTNPTSISLTADDGITSNSPFTLSGNESTFEFSISLSNITKETDIKFTSSSAKRFVVWGASADVSGGSQTQTVDAPTFSPAAGAVTVGTQVSIIQDDAALILYTTDETEPSYENNVGEIYTAPITINTATTIKAIAVDEDGTESTVATAIYTIANPIVNFGSHNNVTLGMWDEDLNDLSSGDGVAAGKTVYVTATPDFGYNLGTISVVDANNNTLTLTENSGNWSFTMPNSNVTINVTSVVDPSIITIWSEDFSSYSANDVPSGGTYKYSCVDGGSATKIYNEYLAGGAKPELLVGKNTGTFTAVIPLNNATGNLTLTYKTNAKELSVSTTTANIEGGGSFSTSGEHTVTFTGVTTSMTTITIVFAATSGENVRLDDIELRGSAQAVTVEAPTFSINSGTYYTAQTVGLSCATEGATIYYSTDDTSWTEYTQALNISNTTTLYAKAVKGSDESTHSSITITIAEKNDVVFNIANKSLAYEETYTITKGTSSSMDIKTDGYVTVSTSNPNVVSVSGMTLTAVAVGTAIITLAVAEGETYKARNVTITVTVTAPSAQTTAPSGNGTIFKETFDKCSSNGGNDDNYATASNTSGSASSNADNENWTMEKDYAASKCAKFGGSSSKGCATTPSITAASGKTYTLTFKAAPWNAETTVMNVTATGATISGVSTDAMTAKQWNDYSAIVTATAESFTISFAADNNRFFLDEVEITDPNASAPSVSATIANSGYGTYCSVYPLNLPADNENYKAYVVTDADESKVTFSQIRGEITGGVPFILYGTPGTYELNTTDSEDAPTTNMLRGTLAPTYLEPETTDYINFIMAGGQFKMIAAAGNLAANKAYLPVSKTVLPEGFGSGSNARLTIVFEDETTTTIQGVTTQKATDAIYNLNGLRVDNPVKGGLYIVNGKKVVLK